MLTGCRCCNDLLFCAVRQTTRYGYCPIPWQYILTKFQQIEAPDFDPSYRDASFFGSTAGNFMKHAPWVNNLMQSLPNSIAELLHPAMATYVNQKRVHNHILPSQPLTDQATGSPSPRARNNLQALHQPPRPRPPHHLPLNSRLQTS